MINTQIVGDRMIQAIKGSLSARAELKTLLRGSGLSSTEEGNRIRIIPISTILLDALGRANLDLPVGLNPVAPACPAGEKSVHERTLPRSTSLASIADVAVTAGTRFAGAGDFQPFSIPTTAALYADAPGTDVQQELSLHS